jgi:hypothetical protein
MLTGDSPAREAGQSRNTRDPQAMDVVGLHLELTVALSGHESSATQTTLAPTTAYDTATNEAVR